MYGRLSDQGGLYSKGDNFKRVGEDRKRLWEGVSRGSKYRI